MKCPICDRDRKPIGHHLSYEPEIVVKVCTQCHLMLHELAKLLPEKFDTIIDWIKQYSHLWENGAEKYKKSKYSREVVTMYEKSDKGKENRSIWMKGYYLKKIHPDEIPKQIEELEKQVERIKKYEGK